MKSDLSSAFDAEEKAVICDRPHRAGRDSARRKPRPSAEDAAQQMDHLVNQLNTLIAEREGGIDRATLLSAPKTDTPTAKPGILSRLFRS